MTFMVTKLQINDKPLIWTCLSDYSFLLHLFKVHLVFGLLKHPAR